MSYIDRFKSALVNTKDVLGIAENVLVNNWEAPLDLDVVGELFKKVYISAKKAGIPLEGNCTTIHWNSVDELAKAVGRNAYFTIGYVVEGGKEFFKFTYEDVELWLKNGPPERLMLHAWLTLDTMEVIDFTYGSTRAAMEPHLAHLKNSLIALSPSEQDENFYYVPLIVKDDFLDLIRARR
ncbi:hypothetical protein L1D12_15470 [Vibrio parahaemolyticus]|uniref:hypothetical protein n=1 Tax=Vibrio parahaemolyticus TaxID=670 RepID=UPI001EFD73B6|nr:hypothetical protein [Vibrio parahaemolyticus]MCG9636683.1 hypothetical protein [Vibrio parahaemolyticus]